MGDLIGTLASAVGIYVGTDIDDLIVLTVLFLSARSGGRPRPWQIWLGQYLGIGLLVAVSGLAALGLTIVPDDRVGLLGIVPLGLGLYGLLTAYRAHGQESPPETVVATGWPAVTGITIANGADNIAVYTPLFRTLGLAGSLLTVAAFAVGVALWLVAGSLLSSHPAVIRVVDEFGHWLVPVVFVVIGLLILV